MIDLPRAPDSITAKPDPRVQPFEHRLIALFVRAQDPQMHSERERPADVSMMCEGMGMDTGFRRNPSR